LAKINKLRKTNLQGSQAVPASVFSRYTFERGQSFKEVKRVKSLEVYFAMSREIPNRAFTAYGRNFDVSIGRAVCETCNVKSNFGTGTAFIIIILLLLFINCNWAYARCSKAEETHGKH
jgi:hypothetical protein